MCKVGHKYFASEIACSLFQEAREKGFSKEDLADYLGVTPRTIQDYTIGHGLPSAGVIFGVWKLVKPVNTLRRLAGYTNCIVVELPEDKSGKLSKVAKLTAEIMKENADVINGVAEAIEDGKLTRTEKLHLIDEVDEAIEALMRLRVSLED
ncbi:phage regulatory CII family protein [Deferribacter abyssi]|uniref:phage regulatory CII family protein n=1 Tax=Deferribacter abyssi TaxID=213806 RepID=UPI003C13CE9A